MAQDRKDSQRIFRESFSLVLEFNGFNA